MNTIPGYEDTVQCPYDEVHQILRSRIQTHIIKCARNYPNVKLETCPFNTAHRFRPEKKAKHLAECDSRETMDRYMYTVQTVNNAAAAAVPAPRPQMPPRSNDNEEENWDHYNTPSYDPNRYAESARVIRQTPHVVPSQRRQFRDDERYRLSQLGREAETGQSQSSRNPY